MFNRRFPFQLFILLIIAKISTCDVGPIKCTMYENNRKCTISDLTVTSKNYTFVPVAPDANAVITFEIVQSRITVLTNNICTTLPKIKKFFAVEQHIERLADYAFKNCADVTEINLEKNNIHELGVDPFSNTKKLNTLHIVGGLLHHIDVNLFSDLSELDTLVFGANGLKELPAEALKNLKKLRFLYIYSNNLVDLDAKGLVENLPDLKKIYLNDNDFHCDHLIEILDIFKAKSISVNDHRYHDFIKRRDYFPRTIDNITCLTQAQLETEKLKRALTESLDKLEDVPIGKEVNRLNKIVDSEIKETDREIAVLSYNLNHTSDTLNGRITNLNLTLQNHTDSIIEMKIIQKDVDQNIKDNTVLQQQLEQKLEDNASAQRQLEEKLKENSAVQLQFELKGVVESYSKHDTSISTLSNHLNETSNVLNGQIIDLNLTLHNNLFGNTDLTNRVGTIRKDLDENIKNNLAVQQRLEKKLKDMVESYRRHDEAIVSLMDEMDKGSGGNNNFITASFGNNMIGVWGCIIALVVVNVIMVTIGCSSIRKFRKFYAHATMFGNEIGQQDSQL